MKIDLIKQQLNVLPKIDYENVTDLDISNNNLSNIDVLSKCKKLQMLICNDNQLTSLNNLPAGLQILGCCGNQLTSLDNLPVSLKVLDCRRNQLQLLNNLPTKLEELYCWGNQLTYFDNFPTTLHTLICFSGYVKYTRLSIWKHISEVKKITTNYRNIYHITCKIKRRQAITALYWLGKQSPLYNSVPRDIVGEVERWL